MPHPVFRARGRLGGGLGLAAGAVYQVLGEVGQRPGQIGVAARVGGVSRLLVCLAEQGLACRGPGGWRRGDADPDRVADRLEVGEYLGLLRAWYRADRVAYHGLRRRVADRRRPAETWGPDTVLDVPVGPDPLADAVVDAAVGLVRHVLGGRRRRGPGRVTPDGGGGSSAATVARAGLDGCRRVGAGWPAADDRRAWRMRRDAGPLARRRQERGEVGCPP